MAILGTFINPTSYLIINSRLTWMDGLVVLVMNEQGNHWTQGKLRGKVNRKKGKIWTSKHDYIWNIYSSFSHNQMSQKQAIEIS